MRRDVLVIALLLWLASPMTATAQRVTRPLLGFPTSDALFDDIVTSAAADARAEMVLVERRLQSRDHPPLITVPETSYLKCLVLRKAR